MTVIHKDGQEVCSEHGILSLEDIKFNNGRIRCRICHNKSANKKRNLNREEFNARQALDRELNPEKWDRIYKRQYANKKKNYGDDLSTLKVCRERKITLSEYKLMVEIQGNKCAICLQEETCKDPKHNRARRLSIDHCHKTGKARALLCHNCNLTIGRFKDDIELMERAIAYVKKHYS
jgi:hypothetical protein